MYHFGFHHSTKEKKNILFRVVAKKFPHFSVSVRLVSISLFLLLLGRGLGAETFFSVYIFDLSQSMNFVSIVLLVLVLLRILLILPVANVEQAQNIKKLLLIGKLLYVLCGGLYFLAGIMQFVPLLIVAAVLNAIGADLIYTSYQTYLRLHTNQREKTRAFGLFFSSFNGALVVGGVASAFLVKVLPLPYLYVFVSVFALLSLLPDRKFVSILVQEESKKERFLGKILLSVFQKSTYHQVFSFLKKYRQYLIFPLLLWLFWSILNYVSYFFVPLLGYQRELSLPEVAIVFVVMRLPYLISFAVPEFRSDIVKNYVVLGIYVVLAILFVALYWVVDFEWIVLLSLGVSLALAFAGPLVISNLSKNIPQKDMGNLTGFQEFFARLGELFGMGFLAVISFFWGLPLVFLLVGAGVILFVGRSLLKVKSKK